MTYSKPNQAISLNGFDGGQGGSVYLSVSRKFSEKLRNLPASMAAPVQIPQGEAKSRAFFAKLANTNAARVAAGGLAMVLVLVQTDSAQAQTASVSVAGLEGVVSVVVQADGTALATLADGSTVTLPAGTFVQTAAGEILVAGATADQIVAAAIAEGGGALGAGALGGGIGAVAAPLGLVAALGAGGGGSSSAGTPAEVITTSGLLVDGYLVGATVFRDLNDDGALSAGEPNTLTDEGGNWTLEVDAGNPDANLISFGGTDISTGKAFTGVLTAPADSTVITPLTTLVQSYVEAQAEAGNTVAPEDAAADIASALGLSGQNILELDPVAEIEKDGGSAEAFQAAAQVASVINAAAASEGDDAEASAAVAASLADALLNAAEGDEGGDGSAALSDATVIDAALEAGGVEEDDLVAVGGAIEQANTLIATAGNGGTTVAEIQEQIEKVQEVVQGDLVEAIEDAAENEADVAVVNVEEAADALVTLRPTISDASATYGSTELADGLDLSGTGRPGSTVKVTIDGEEKTTVVGEASIEGGSGTWSISFAQADLPEATGEFDIEARASVDGTTAFTTPTEGGTLTVDLTAPDVQFTNLPTEAVSLVEQNQDVTISGTTEVGATVKVTFNGVEKAATVDDSGGFTAMFDGAVNTGETSVAVSAVATDALGNESEALSATVPLQPISALTPVFGELPETLNLDDVSEGGLITGTGIAGSEVTLQISIDGSEAALLGTEIVGSDGSWSVLVPSSEFDDTPTGDYVFSASASLSNGEILSATASSAPIAGDFTAPDDAANVAVAGDGKLSLEESESPVVVTGTAEAGSTVSVTLGDATLTDDTVGDDGVFSVEFAATDVPDGATTDVKTTVTDAAGNAGEETTATLTIEQESALIPAAADVTQTLGQTGLDAGLTVSGSGRAGSTIAVTIDGTEKTQTLGADETSWSIDFATADLPDAGGDFDVSVTASIAGTTLETEAVSAGTLTVDLSVPDGPVINAIAANDVLDVIEARSDLVVTGTAVAGTTVKVTLGAVELEDVADEGTFEVTFTTDQLAGLPANASISAVSVDGLGAESASTVRAFAVSSPIVGTGGEDELVGTAGNDVFQLRTGGETKGSAGNDEIDFSDDGLTYQEVDYSDLGEAIDATIDYDGTSTVAKGTLGDDSLVGLTGSDEGFGIKTTAQDDTITVKQSDELYSWTGILYEGGDDTVNIELSEGATRLSFRGDDAVDVDLGAGTATVHRENEDNSTVTINLTPSTDAGAWGRVEIEGSDVTDSLTGSDLDDRFIGRGGQDTIDGGDGTDLTRYDRDEASAGVFVDLYDEGQAIGMWDGEGFTHRLNNIEDVRGSDGKDVLIAGEEGSRLEGNDGDDLLIGEEGDDQFVGGEGADVFMTNKGSDYISDFEVGVDKLDVSEGEFVTDENIEWTFATIMFEGESYAQMSRDVSDEFGSGGDTHFITFGNGVTQDALEAAYDAGTLFYELPVPTGPVIVGTAGEDTLAGTDGNDAIDLGANTSGEYLTDVIRASAGADYIDLSDATNETFVFLDYDTITDNGIVAFLNMDETDDESSLILKIGDGIDFLEGLQAPGEGIALSGTGNNDLIDVIYSQSDYQWFGYNHTGGHDLVQIEHGSGGFRLSIGGDDADVVADLAAGNISAGADETVNMVTYYDWDSDPDLKTLIELRTYGGDDNVVGTENDDRFILGAGDDTVDGGDGFDVVRYDRNISEVDGVSVNLGASDRLGIAANTATGTWGGEAFTHSLTSIEAVRGSRGDDLLIASDNGSYLSGRGGDDILVGGAGEDYFHIGAGHAEIHNFDFSRDNLELEDERDEDDVVFEELTVGDVTSTKASFVGDDTNSLTFVGVTLDELTAWIGDDSPELPALTDPMVITLAGGLKYDPMLFAMRDGIFDNTSTAIEVKFDYTDPNNSDVYALTYTGTGLLNNDGTGLSEDGVLTTVVVDVVFSNGDEAHRTFENIQLTVAEFEASFESLSDPDYYPGPIGRDVLYIGSDGNDDLGNSGDNMWISAGAGEDEIYVDPANGDVAIVSGNEADEIYIWQDSYDDQTLIFIDQEEQTDTDIIDGFRITNSEETGDVLVLVGQGNTNSNFSGGFADLEVGTLNSGISGWGEYVTAGETNVGLFTSGVSGATTGVLYELTNVNGTVSVGDKIADLTNVDTPDFNGGGVDPFNFIRFTDELPVLSELV
jgi:hypothetical protein